MKEKIKELLADQPIIPAIKNDDGLNAVLKTDGEIVFVLYGNVLNISEIVRKLKESGKIVFVNVDLIEGFASKEIVVEYLKKNTKADGILSNKAAMIRAAKALGFLTIHRYFVIDSFSYENLEKQLEISQPDFLEVLPGWPRMISWVVGKVNIPVIAGGLVCTKEDVVAALGAGATAICSTNQDVWLL